MKRILSFILALFILALPIAAAAEEDMPYLRDIFPDRIFLSYVKSEILKDENAERLTPGVRAEFAKKRAITVERLHISDLKGIEYFPSLTWLSCNGNRLRELDVSGNPELERLYCFDNMLREIDVSRNKKLKYFDCSSNDIYSVDVSSNTELLTFGCAFNHIEELDLSCNTKLESLDCSNNRLSTLIVPDGLKSLYCAENSITELYLGSMANGAYFNCSGNMINKLDTVGNGYDHNSLAYNNPIYEKSDDLYLNSNYYSYNYDAVPVSMNGSYFIDLKALAGSDLFKCDRVSVQTAGCKYDANKGTVYFSDFRKSIVFHYNYGNRSYLIGTVRLDYGKDGSPYTEKHDASLTERTVDASLTYAQAFPDEVFRNIVFTEILHAPVYDADTRIDPECIRSISRIKELKVKERGIKKLDGIEYFASLEVLDCSHNEISFLDLSANRKLTDLDCSYNQLKVLNTSYNKELVKLNCSWNILYAVDVSGCPSLKEFDASSNLLKNVDLGKNAGLERLNCYDNVIDYIDLSKNVMLRSLTLFNNELTELDVSECKNLSYINCASNKIVKILYATDGVRTYGSPDASGADIYISGNRLTYFDPTDYKFYRTNVTMQRASAPVYAYGAKYALYIKDLFKNEDGSSAYDPDKIQINLHDVEFDAERGMVVFDEKIAELKYVYVMRNSVKSDVTLSLEYMPTSFTDVDKNAYFYDAVMWAERGGIASGKAIGSFCPNDECTVAQALTFLWRAAGCPEYGDVGLHADIPTEAFYADALIWAIENGIADAGEAGSFDPEAPLRRAQMVKIIYLFSGERAVDGAELPFTDVRAESDTAEALIWGYSNGVARGRPDGSFFPDGICSRAEAVSFLYRYSHSV